MNCSRNDLILLPVPFTDLSSVKVRPAVVVGHGSWPGDLFVVPVTPQLGKVDLTLADWKQAGLDLLPKVIFERPSLREPSARRDEGVDEHPQPKNNAAIGFRRPELENTSREAASCSKTQSFSFRKGLLANGLNVPSGIKGQLCTIDSDLVRKVIGRISPVDQIHLDALLKSWLELA